MSENLVEEVEVVEGVEGRSLAALGMTE